MNSTIQFKVGVATLVAALTGCAVPVDDAGSDATNDSVGTTTEALSTNSNYVAAVTGGLEIKKKLLVTSTVTTPSIRKGRVTFGPTPESCTMRSDGVQACQYTMSWRGVVVDNFSVNGKTISNLTVDTWAPIPVTVAQGKFTIPANTARFTLSGTSNGAFFLIDRTLDSDMTGTFTPNGAFNIKGTVTRYVSGPIGIDVRVWGNFNLSGTAVNTAPTCRSTGSGQFACEPGGQPTGACRPTKVHRTVYQCNGSNKSVEEIIDLANGYSNYTCSNRFVQHCINDGSFDSYYSEWCDFSCP